MKPPVLNRAERYDLAIPYLLIAALLGSILMAGLLERRDALVTAGEERLYLPDATYAKPLLLGYHGAAADLLWMRIVQYVGSYVEADKRYPQLARALDLVTSLDPHFIEPYRFGGLFLQVLAREPDAAVSLLEKGAAANPDRWELPHDLGRYYFLEAHDDAKALWWWERAVTLPGRPDYLPRFVARLYARTGHLETALTLWAEIYGTAQNDYFKAMALREIERLKTGHARLQR